MGLMTRLPMMTHAERITAHANGLQAWFFVCVGLGRSAVVTDAYIGKDAAQRAARAVGGKVRQGFVGPRALGTVTYALIPSAKTTPAEIKLALGR